MELELGGGLEGLAIYVSLVGVQLGYAMMGIVMKNELSKGMDPLSLIIYSNAFGVLVLSPFAFIIEKKKRPKLSFSLAGKFFVVSLAGVWPQGSLFQTLLLMGLRNTSPAFASAMPNLAPALIFVMAWSLGMEKVDIMSRHSRFKIIGTIVCVCGVMAMSFLQGPAFSQLWSHSGNATHTANTIFRNILQDGDSNKKIIGCIYLVSAVVMLSSSMILQAEILKKYPATLSLTAITGLLGSIQTAILKICMERGIHTTSWSLDWSGLSTVVFVAIIGNVLALAVLIWCLKKRGPVFVAIFSPVSTVCSAIFSGETLRLGSMMGVVLIFAGLYLVLWGKSKDNMSGVISSSDVEDQVNNTDVDHPCEVVDAKAPLLPRK